MNAKKVIVACGTGIATSTVVADKISEACKKEGISVNIIQCKVTELRSYADGADLIVSTTILKDKFDVPVINGLPFITGIGEERAIQDIINVLKK
ncbi:Galactitol-specific phosphotransferase enzyme IIB component [Fervidicola ferrireducens]|uniref:Galactitol-specific phosphotransferase enzyme IIB component n=1 Tax=Fervidicola ferrireducens TaxID=520764 RepID=A0A140L278_9FIRM|nr:PTS sugar transporter subunit IIB [Fervidicola ferrireducens]KXG74653.1 Galactitol-specific phosphotransferase enzyme IIB component [Fervidicola ferrireducens]